MGVNRGGYGVYRLRSVVNHERYDVNYTRYAGNRGEDVVNHGRYSVKYRVDVVNFMMDGVKRGGDNVNGVSDVVNHQVDKEACDALENPLRSVAEAIRPIKLVSASAKSPGKPVVSLPRLRRALSNATRWRILSVLYDQGPMATDFIAKAVKQTKQNTSKHLVFMRSAGILERRMGRLYGIPAAFMVPGERTLDFGAIVLRLDQATEKG